MKLIIQIPCFNEEKTLPDVLRDLPRHIEGIDIIETQVIDDGSTDDTVRVARELGVDHIISFPKNRGLAAAFRAGVQNALALHADILVNTDGDNQYRGADVARLIQTMREERADVVIGCRPISAHPEFSMVKKFLQHAGSGVVRAVSNTDIPDATSGFRAYSRESLLRLNVVSDFSYCLETIIQAGLSNMKVVATDIEVNPKTRESRLFGNIFEYVFKQLKTIVSIFILYRSNVFFGVIALVFFFIALSFVVRYLLLISLGGAPSNMFWPSIILSAVMLILSVLTYLVGTIASLMRAQRKLTEEVVYHLRCLNIVDRRKFLDKP